MKIARNGMQVHGLIKWKTMDSSQGVSKQQAFCRAPRVQKQSSPSNPVQDWSVTAATARTESATAKRDAGAGFLTEKKKEKKR